MVFPVIRKILFRVNQFLWPERKYDLLCNFYEKQDDRATTSRLSKEFWQTVAWSLSNFGDRHQTNKSVWMPVPWPVLFCTSYVIQSSTGKNAILYRVTEIRNCWHCSVTLNMIVYGAFWWVSTVTGAQWFIAAIALFHHCPLLVHRQSSVSDCDWPTHRCKTDQKTAPNR